MDTGCVSSVNKQGNVIGRLQIPESPGWSKLLAADPYFDSQPFSIPCDLQVERSAGFVHNTGNKQSGRIGKSQQFPFSVRDRSDVRNCHRILKEKRGRNDLITHESDVTSVVAQHSMLRKTAFFGV